MNILTSVYAGETWTAYRPGEDERFTDAWVSRDGTGDLCTCVNSKKVLIANAKHNQVRLKWYNRENPCNPQKCMNKSKLPMNPSERVDMLIADKNKQAVKKANAKQFFNDLIVSLTKEKSKWTATERMQFNRVSAFLNA